MSQLLPELVTDYAEFVDFRNQSENEGVVNLESRNWLGSTSVLLIAYLKTKYKCEVMSTGHSKAKRYLDQMTQDPTWWRKEIKLLLSTGNSYVPFSVLPQEEDDFKTLYTKVSELLNVHKPVGGETAFKYVLSELTDNIYEHSEFENSFMMCQAYKKKGYVELSFIDDGVSIPKNFEKHEINFEGDWNAIEKAVNGYSTKDKDERGTGLKSSLQIYCEGAGAEAMIVSRSGLYYKRAEETKLFRLNEQQTFPGTLISIRIPMKIENIDIYKYA